MTYDQLVLALGSKTNRAMIPGSEHAFTFKTLADALPLRNHVIERFERADVETDPRRKAQLLTFVVIGGRLVGVELLGELTAFVDGIAPSIPNWTRRVRSSCSARRPDHARDRPRLADYGAGSGGGRRVGADPARVRAIEPGPVHLAGDVAADTIVLAAGRSPTRWSRGCR